MGLLKENQIHGICKEYGISVRTIGKVIDTSRGEDDLRFHYSINDKYFLKVTNTVVVDEEFLQSVHSLINRYQSIGVYCPNLMKNGHDGFSVVIEASGNTFTCYLEEKAKYSCRDEEHVDYNFKKSFLPHVGKLASKYTGHKLIDRRSMWSVVYLAPLDHDIDEKQENFNRLIECLLSNGHHALARQLVEQNDLARARIRQVIDDLPSTVFQGDLNSSNILVDREGSFKGIIDFNLSGTEVNVNLFLNEAMYFLTEKDFVELSSKEILSKVIKNQGELMKCILSEYDLNALEKAIIPYYNQVIYTSFYPNVILMIEMMKNDKWSEKVIGYLTNCIE